MNDTRWKPGKSGNPLGRPKGTRDQFSKTVLADLSAVWAEHGRSAMEKTALCEPAKFVAICAGLIPKDVQVSLQARLPGNLEPDDWALATEVFGAIREALPDASKRAPGEVLAFVADAIRAQNAEIVATALPQPSETRESANNSTEANRLVIVGAGDGE